MPRSRKNRDARREAQAEQSDHTTGRVTSTHKPIFSDFPPDAEVFPTIDAMVDHLTSTIDDLRLQLADAPEKNRQLEARLDTLRVQHAARVNELTNQLRDAQSARDRLAEEVNNLSEKLESCDFTIADLSRGITTRDELGRQLERKLEEANGTIIALRLKLGSSNQALLDLEEKFNNADEPEKTDPDGEETTSPEGPHLHIGVDRLDEKIAEAVDEMNREWPDVIKDDLFTNAAKVFRFNLNDPEDRSKLKDLLIPSMYGGPDFLHNLTVKKLDADYIEKPDSTPFDDLVEKIRNINSESQSVADPATWLIDPDHKYMRRFGCGHIQSACCFDHLDNECEICTHPDRASH